jgi:outer membrane protein
MIVQWIVGMRSGRATVARLAGLLVLCAAPALGQALKAPLDVSPDRPAPVLRLTLDEAVRLGLDNNLDIRVDRIEPQVAAEREAQARGAYVPTLTSNLTRNGQLAPPSNFLVGNAGVRSDSFAGTIGVSHRLPWMGTSYAVGWDASRSTSTSFLNNFNPTYTSRLQFSFAQPLLRDFTIDASRQQLIVSKRNREISDTRFRETVVRTLADVKRGYWDLVAARALVDVQRQSLELAQDLARQNKARVDVGQSPPLDLVSAQAEVAQREENLLIAQSNARQAEDRLRVLILDSSSPAFWDEGIDAVDRPTLENATPDLDGIVTTALDSRQDLIRARDELANARTNTRLTRNQTLPDLRLQVNLQTSGLGGTRLIRTGGFPGTVVGSELVAFGTVMRQVWQRSYPTWTVGVNLAYPLGKGIEDAVAARAKLEEQQATDRLRSLEMKAVRQLRQSAWQMELNAKRIVTSRAARSLAEQRLSVEQKRFDVGMSTSFFVVQAQRDLATARNNELSALLEFNRSLIDFESLQVAGPAQGASAGSSIAVSSGSSAASGAAASLQPAGSSSTVVR